MKMLPLIVSGPCSACMLAKVEQERLESLKYDRATIYVKCIDENEEYKTDNDYEVTQKYLQSIISLINCEWRLLT